MKKKNLCISLIIMGLIVSLCACNKANETVNTEVPTSVPTEAPTPEPTEVPTIGNNTNVIEDTENNNTENSTTDITEEVPSISDIPVAPDNSETTENETIDKSEADKFPGEDKEPTKVPTQAPTEAPDEPTATPTPTEKPEVTVTPTPGVTETPVEPTKTPTEAPTATPTPDVTVTPTPEVTVTPDPTPTPEVTVTPEPTPTTKPDTSIKVIWQSKEYPENDAGYGNGKDITLGNIGISIPTLDEFNNFGVGESGTGWIGDKGAEEQLLGDVLDDVRYTLIDKEVIGTTAQAFLYTNYNIGFSYSMGSEDIHLQRDPNSDTYTLTINRDLKYDYSAGMQLDRAPYNRDIVKVMLSVVTSDVEKVYDYLYEGMYGDSSNITVNSYTAVGDCKIKLDKNVSVADGKIKHITFYIQGN